MSKFTVIYMESFMSGSHWHQIVRIEHVLAESAESACGMVDGEPVFVFNGHIESL